MIVAGIMSGTSLDGIDVAIVEMPSAKLLHFTTKPYPPGIRKRLLAVSNTTTHTREIARLHFELPALYAKALAGRKIDLCGCHGQTIYHEGPRCTLQIGDGNVLAARLGVPVVSDFRPADIAAGGHGAPLVPFTDYRFFRHRTRWRVGLNIGGIANITSIPPGAKLHEVTAMDTGPGNMVIDALTQHFTGKTYDRNGKLAAQGHINRNLLDKLLRDRYYSAHPPKTAGREQYGKEFIANLLATKLPANDLIATATALTAATIAKQIRQFTQAQDVIASGGGTNNPQLMAQLAAYLPGVNIENSRDHGLDPDAKEAIAFALMAYETWRRRPSNVPTATGAKRPAILGKLCLP